MLIVDGHVVDPATGLHEIADVLIEQDCIKKIYVRSRGEQADHNEAQENGHLVIDAKGKYVFPGLIDSHAGHGHECGSHRLRAQKRRLPCNSRLRPSCGMLERVIGKALSVATGSR